MFGTTSNPTMLNFEKPKLLSRSKILREYLNKLLYNNNAIISSIFINLLNKTVYIKFQLYFLVSLEKGEKKLFLKKVSKAINNFFKNQFKIFDIKTISLKVYNLNILIRKKIIKKIYFKFFKFEKFIFLQNRKFFINFINITYLFINKNIKPRCFLVIIGKLFAQLTKKAHSQFFLFIKVLINWCISIRNEDSYLKGIKFSINGRIKGKPRSNNYKVLSGKISCQTIDSKVQYCYMHVYNRYGAFGLKLWVR